MTEIKYKRVRPCPKKKAKPKKKKSNPDNTDYSKPYRNV